MKLNDPEKQKWKKRILRQWRKHSKLYILVYPSCVAYPRLNQTTIDSY